MIRNALSFIAFLAFLALPKLTHGQDVKGPEAMERAAGTRFLSLQPGSAWRLLTFTRLPELERSADADARKLAKLARILDGPSAVGTKRLALYALRRDQDGVESWFRIRVQETQDVEKFLETRAGTVRATAAREGARELEQNDVRGLRMRFARFEVPTTRGTTWPFEWYAWSIENQVLELVPLSFWVDMQALSSDARAVSVDLTLQDQQLYPDPNADQEHERFVGIWLVGLAVFFIVLRWLMGRRTS